MMKIVAWKEEGYFWCTDCQQSIAYTEDSIWQNLARAYDAELELVPLNQYDLPDGLTGTIVVLDEKAQQKLDDFEWPAKDVNIVVGRAALDMSHLPGTHLVVPVPDTGVFGFCIAAIALEDHRRKTNNGD
jgi:hypothetical protein